jgi:hypothetical protein
MCKKQVRSVLISGKFGLATTRFASVYCTVSVNCCDWVVLPEVAVTVSV